MRDGDQAGPVDIGVYSIAGAKVRSIQTQASAAGWVQVSWNGVGDDGQTVPSGVYFLRAHSGQHSETVRAVLLK